MSISCTGARPRHRLPLSPLTLLALLLGGALVPSTVGALTYVMPTDDELLERAEIVVLATVMAADNAPTDLRAATDYLVEIDDLIKGFVPAGTILVRVPGGVRSDGMRVKAFGVPELAAGERVLLFLTPQSTGTYQLVELGLGTFRVRNDTPRPLLVRDLSAATELRRGNDARSDVRRRSHLPRDLERFVSWLHDAEGGNGRPADYFVEAPLGPVRSADAFTLTRSPFQCGANEGLPVRWTEFEEGRSVRILVNENLQPGVADGGIGGIKRSITTWNNDPQSVVRLVYGGTTSASARASDESDDRNLVLFEDPYAEIPGTFSGSGTLAVTWVAFDCKTTHTFGSEMAHTLFEADIVTNDGSGSFYFSNGTSEDYDEVIAHELGHFLGLGHSCGDSESPLCSSSTAFNDALMRATVHSDGRGATLRSDDRAGIRFLYPMNTATNEVPAAPSSLTAVALSTSEIELTWLDNASDETAYDIEERSVDGEFVLLATRPANTTSLIVDKIPPGTFRAYRVRARNANGPSTESNEASTTTPIPVGACVEDDETLCLNEDRFQVRIAFQDFQGATGQATAEELTDDTGYFTFFDAANVEVVVKALDACAVSDRYWVFAGGLTNVEAIVTVSDTTTGDTKTYFNALGDAFLPVQDTDAFASCP